MIIEMPVRRQFMELVGGDARFSIAVCHRRAGKTVACLQKILKAAIECKRPMPRYAYIAPYLKQSKQVAWDYLRHMAGPLEAAVNESELRIDLKSGARIRLFGADNFEAIRGSYFDGVVLDEFADMDPRAWTSVLSPALSDRIGWAVFIGTPKGRNSFHDLWRQAEGSGWFRLMLRASETKLVDAGELELQRKLMSEDEYQQEYECSFDAAIKGAYYGKLMAEAEEARRICGVPYDPKAPVGAAWDLGIGDATAIVIYQLVGREVHVIDYIEESGVGLDHYAERLRSLPYKNWDDSILPHDAEAKELGTGKSRRETLFGLGIKSRVAPRLGVDDGIAAARALIPRTWFDAKKCARLVDALRQYRAEWDEGRKVLKRSPLHDWASHPADAFRYLAVGLNERRQASKINYPRLANVA